MAFKACSSVVAEDVEIEEKRKQLERIRSDRSVANQDEKVRELEVSIRQLESAQEAAEDRTLISKKDFAQALQPQ